MIGQAFSELLERARAGDEQSFAALWRDLNPPLLRYLRVIAPRDADDLASEAWVSVARGLDRFTGDEHAFRAWIFVTARRRAFDHFRRERRHPAVPVDPLHLRESVVVARSPVDQLVDACSTAEALALVALLPPDQAEVVALRVIAGLDVAQVAQIIGKRPGTVRVLAHRGLRRLAAHLTTPTAPGGDHDATEVVRDTAVVLDPELVRDTNVPADATKVIR